MSAVPLIAALEAAALALEADDLPAAQAALARAEAAAAELQAVGARLGDAERTLAASLQGRCQRAAGPARERLLAELRLAGRGNRAVTAYGG